MKKAANQTEYQAIWDLFELEDQAPSTDFDDEDVLFFGYTEAGRGEANCPIIINHIEMSSNYETMTVSLKETYPYGGCNDVETPRTSVGKEISKDVAAIIVEEDGKETTLTLEK